MSKIYFEFYSYTNTNKKQKIMMQRININQKKLLVFMYLTALRTEHVYSIFKYTELQKYIKNIFDAPFFQTGKIS